MGYTQACALSEDVSTGTLTLDDAVRVHLTGNVFPPRPSLTPCAVKAVKACRKERYGDLIRLPAGCTYKTEKSAPARAIVEWLRLEQFV